MNLLAATKAISITLFLSVIAVAMLGVPQAEWNMAGIFSLVLLAGYASFPFFAVPKESDKNNNTKIFAYLGPSFVLSFGLFIWGTISLAISILWIQSIAWIMNIIGICFFVVFYIYLKVGLKIIAPSDKTGPEVPSVSDWTASLERVSLSISDKALKSEVAQIGKSLRFSASDVRGSPLKISGEISNQIDDLERGAVNRNFDLAYAISNLKLLVLRREAELRKLRSRH